MDAEETLNVPTVEQLPVISKIIHNITHTPVLSQNDDVIKGEFQLIPDPVPYETVADIYQSVKITSTPEGQTRYKNLVKISLEDGVEIKTNENLAFTGVEQQGSEIFLQCRRLNKKNSSALLLPMNCVGKFQEYPDRRYYKINKIIDWKMLWGRQRLIKPAPESPMHHENFLIPEGFTGCISLAVSYSVKAVVDGKEIVIPPDMDFDVVEISEEGSKTPVTEKLTALKIYKYMADSFPLKVRIIDTTDKKDKSRTGDCLLILKKQMDKKYLITEMNSTSSKRHFVVPLSYKGMVTRIPRIFPFVYDVQLADDFEGNMKIIATKEFVSEWKELSSFTSGDQFSSMRCGKVPVKIGRKRQLTDVIQCKNVATDADITLPFYAEGQFFEVIGRGVSCTLSDFLTYNSMSCHLKVTTKDPFIKNDPLIHVSAFMIEKQITEECLVAACLQNSCEVFKLPIHRTPYIFQADTNISLKSVQTLNSPVPLIEEVTEDFYYLSQKEYEVVVIPPPLPPRQRTSMVSCVSFAQKPPPLPPKPSKVLSSMESLSLVK
ncbi:protein THEMIS3-like [Protopterus annectens]|uniref:protein THEMIS3-like n=1 Tax=Protopterus annectens TaxID=7888 RepID=UPI001CFA84F6|nr:protein THEMIS3-like [Protopterus annectens]